MMIKNTPFIDRPDFPLQHPASWIASWGGCGFLRSGPGTWGTLGALPAAFLILYFGGAMALAIATLLCTLIGLWAINILQHDLNIDDDSRIVVDEVVGIWIAILCIPITPLAVLLAVILFRVLDIAKPFPIGWLDRNIGGAWGVMADDMLAGLLTGIIVAMGMAYFG